MAMAPTTIKIDLGPFVAKLKVKELRKSRPWTGDIIRTLSGRASVTMDQLVTDLWEIRNQSGLPVPKAFRQTIQSTLNHHTSQSDVFRGPVEDDLFYSPRGKRSGTWAVHPDRAKAWLETHRIED